MTTVATNIDVTNQSPAKDVKRMVVPVTILDTASSGEKDVGFIGRILKMKYDVPDLTGAGTLTVDLLDEDDTSLYQKAAIAENAISAYDVGMVAAATPHGIVYAGVLTVKCTASAGAQTGDQLINVVIIYI